MAKAFGQDPFRIMREWPERFKIIALGWLEEQWNKPSRTDWQLIRIAQRVHQRSKGAASLKEQQVLFGPPPTPEERMAASKAAWTAGLRAASKNKGRGPGQWQ